MRLKSWCRFPIPCIRGCLGCPGHATSRSARGLSKHWRGFNVAAARSSTDHLHLTRAGSVSPCYVLPECAPAADELALGCERQLQPASFLMRAR